jgi:hypothetical protein
MAWPMLCMPHDARGKEDCCKCGCRGWCSLFPVLDVLRWSLSQAAVGTNDTRRHDGSQFDPILDARRTLSPAHDTHTSTIPTFTRRCSAHRHEIYAHLTRSHIAYARGPQKVYETSSGGCGCLCLCVSGDARGFLLGGSLSAAIAWPVVLLLQSCGQIGLHWLRPWDTGRGHIIGTRVSCVHAPETQ